jgi:hypothetical protein
MILKSRKVRQNTEQLLLREFGEYDTMIVGPEQVGRGVGLPSNRAAAMARARKPVGEVDDRHLRLDYMGGRCSICRRSIKAVEHRYLTSKGTFEFNHIDPIQKSPIYKKLIRRAISSDQLDELDKCNLLCRVCHGAWHNQRLRGKSTFTITLPDGRVVKKRVPFHGLIEFHKPKPKIHFFPDKPYELEIYGYRLGSSKMLYRVGFELEKDLGRLLLATRRRHALRIWDRKGLVFKAERREATHLRFQFSVRFSILKFEGRPDSPQPPCIWVRNGKVVIRGRGVRKTGLVSGEMQYTEIERAQATKAAKAT